MASKWLIGLAILFGIGVVLSNIIEYTAPMQGGATTIWNAISTWQSVNFADVTTWWNIFTGLGQMFTAMWNMFIWNYSFLQGDWQYLRWLICFPISLGLIFSIIMAIRGSSSS